MLGVRAVLPRGAAQDSCIVKLLSGAEHNPVQSTKLQARYHMLITLTKWCVLPHPPPENPH